MLKYLFALTLILALFAHPIYAQDRPVITAENAAQLVPVDLLKGHEGAVNSVVFSPDGTLLASGGEDNLARLWDIETLAEPTLLEGNTGAINALAFSPNGDLLVSAGDIENITLLIWNVADGSVATQFKYDQSIANVMGPHYLFTVGFSSDGERVYAGGDHGQYAAWDATTNEFAVSYRWGGVPAINSLSFSPDGAFLALAKDYDGVLLSPLDEQGDLADEAITLDCSDNATSVMFDASSSMIAAGSRDGMICLWNVDDLSEIRIINAGNNAITGLSFSPDGTLLVSASRDGSLQVWNVETLENIAQFSMEADTELHSVAFSPDGTLIASAGSDGVITLWGIDE